ncbi:histamine H2 receptor-like [Stylophora pistillata]|uniref:histamine H2 receptor-like n=1 Tax=Stylophora pistillata TaxID=50429 RepID=UPI000C03E69F|nr:histamine H2 receptor-like [Stylophora pistillata]
MSAANQNTSNIDRANSGLNASSNDSDPILEELFPVIGFLMCTVGSIGNFAILFAFLTQRKLRTKLNCFLASLAFSDLLLMGITVPLELEYHIQKKFIHGVVICELMYTIHFLALSSSSLNLLAVSVYRYITIAFPFSARLVRPIHIVATIAVLWLYAVMTALLPLMGWRLRPSLIKYNLCVFSIEPEYVMFILTVNWVIPALIVVILYVMIFRIARIHAIKIARQQVLREYERIRSPLFKCAKTLGKIAIVCLICWLPYVTETILLLSHGSSLVPRAVHLIFILCYYANSAINPFLYAGLCTDFREVFTKCASKVYNKLSLLCRRVSAFFHSVVSSLCSDSSRTGAHATERSRLRRSRKRARTRSGSSSQQPSVATFV